MSRLNTNIRVKLIRILRKLKMGSKIFLKNYLGATIKYELTHAPTINN